MPAFQVKLIRSWAGASERHRRTLEGLGLYKISDVRLLPGTEASLGMIKQVGHLVAYEKVEQEYRPSGRRHTQGKKTASKKSEGKKAS